MNRVGFVHTNSYIPLTPHTCGVRGIDRHIDTHTHTYIHTYIHTYEQSGIHIYIHHFFTIILLLVLYHLVFQTELICTSFYNLTIQLYKLLSRIFTRIEDFIPFDNNRYVKCAYMVLHPGAAKIQLLFAHPHKYFVLFL